MKLSSDISAVVTGGASGLGAATARRLAASGVKVAVFDLNEAAGEALAKEVGGVFCKVDVTSDEQVDAGFAKARAAHGQERVLVNCAGTGNAIKTASRDKKTGEIKSFPSAHFDRIIQINLVGTFRCIAKSAAGMLTLPPLEGGERGVIVNTASVAAQDGQIGQVIYASAKAGVNGMVLPLARDLSDLGIRVNSIMPGIFATPLMLGAKQNVLDSLSASVPFPKRLGKPEDLTRKGQVLSLLIPYNCSRCRATTQRLVDFSQHGDELRLGRVPRIKCAICSGPVTCVVSETWFSRLQTLPQTVVSDELRRTRDRRRQLIRSRLRHKQAMRVAVRNPIQPQTLVAEQQLSAAPQKVDPQRHHARHTFVGLRQRPQRLHKRTSHGTVVAVCKQLL